MNIKELLSILNKLAKAYLLLFIILFIIIGFVQYLNAIYNVIVYIAFKINKDNTGIYTQNEIEEIEEIKKHIETSFVVVIGGTLFLIFCMFSIWYQSTTQSALPGING